MGVHGVKDWKFFRWVCFWFNNFGSISFCSFFLTSCKGAGGGGDFMNLYLPVHMSVWDFLEICYLVFSEILHGDRKLEISDRNEYLVKIFVCFNRIGKKDPK